ncbi:FAD binding domain-containing protein [Pyricularia oryzae]|nr:FAD binding domain-containing protein [Pyricularia oryzae]
MRITIPQLLLFVVAAPITGHLRDAQKHCKVTPLDAGWPSSEEWDRLNSTISGRLVRPVPPGAVCHADQPSHSTDGCIATQSQWRDPSFHLGDPVSVDWDNWANDTCAPDPEVGCSDAGYPVYVVNATEPEHVQAGVDFARNNNIRLVVKNSGHDYLGRSNAPFSLSIWVHHMKDMRIHEAGSFQPRNCPSDNLTHPRQDVVVTFGAGTEMGEAYRFTAAVNRTIVGGNGPTVALGGLITGGGHSILSPHHGLAVDQVLEMEMVDAEGRLLTLNECENEDLFFAVRGGGGSTFGILTSITMRTLKSPSVLGLGFSMITSADSPHALDAMVYFITQIPALAAAGISGYPIMHKAKPLGNVTYTGVVGILIMRDSSNPEDIMKLIQPIFSHANTTWPGHFVFTSQVVAHANFYSWYQQNYDKSQAGRSLVAASQLLDGQALKRNETAIRAVLEAVLDGGEAGFYMVSGKGVRDGGRTAVNPAWAEAVVHAATGVGFPSHDADAAAKASANAKRFSAALRSLCLNSGGAAYVNEAHPDEDDWQHEFWGSNYDRLREIKKKRDPETVFWCHPCVGNEEWEVRDGRLCQVDGSQWDVQGWRQ